MRQKRLLTCWYPLVHQVCICARTHLTHELTANTSVGTVPRGPAANNKPSRTRETQAAKHPIENAPLQPPPRRQGGISARAPEIKAGRAVPACLCAMQAGQSMGHLGLSEVVGGDEPKFDYCHTTARRLLCVCGRTLRVARETGAGSTIL